MVLKTLSYLLIACIGFSSIYVAKAHADEANPPSKQRVQLVTDQENGVLSIQIDDEVVAFFTKDGLHVVKSIQYGGTITDLGVDELKSSFDALSTKEKANDEK